MMCPYSSYRDAISRSFVLWAISIYLLISAVSGRVCTVPDTVGSLDNNEEVIEQGQTYILAGYTVDCEGIVTTWEFCYQVHGASLVTFYPGIWKITGSSSSRTTFSLVQSNTVTFNPSVGITFSCQNYTLPVTERYTAPSGSVVGLYSNTGVVLLRTRNEGQIETFKINGNQSSGTYGSNVDTNYNIAIRVHLGIQCQMLLPPSNGKIASCSSGTEGVGYEGDTCSFTCNTGYELTGSDTRTCQSDGNWSDSDDVCRRVECPLLPDSSNGTINCSLGDDAVPSHEDTCSFTCNTGYALTGSPQRTCQSNGSWSGSPVSCTIMECPSSSLPMNSMLAMSCSNTYQSMCDLQCEEGFNGSGDPSYVCDVLSDGSVMWMASGGGWSCERAIPTISSPVTATRSTPDMTITSTAVMATNSTAAVPTTSTAATATISTVAMATTLTAIPTTSIAVMSTTLTAAMATTSTAAMATTSTVALATTSTAALAIISTAAMATTSTAAIATTSTPAMLTTLTAVMPTTFTAAMPTTFTAAMATTSTPAMPTTSTAAMPTTLTAAIATTSTAAMPTTLTAAMATTLTAAMATTSTAAMPTTLTPAMPTTLTAAMAVTSTTAMPTTSTPQMPINTIGSVNENTDSGSSSSGAAGIAAGCVIGIVICIIIILLIILLLWYRKRKKGKLNIEQVNIELENCTKHADDSSQYSAVGKPINNGTIVIKNPGPDYETPEFWRNDVYKSSEPVSYLAPDSTIDRHLPKVESNDYEALENVDIYSSALHTYSDTMNDSHVPSDIYDDTKEADYTEVPDVDEDTRESIVGDAVNGGEEEEIFLDPGHSEEAIYSCFERKMFRTIKADNVKILQKLGSGEFGIVHLGTWSDGLASHKQVAVKTLNAESSISDRIKFLREAAIMGQFKDNHIVELYGVITEKENTMIMLEYMHKGDLREFLIDLKTTTPPEAFGELKHDLLSFCRHVAAGLNYLANKHFVHRDLAARNILVSSDDVCKIADFGMARDVTDDTYYMSTGGKIPVKWTAPEAIFYKKYSTQSDVWSFGCVMYEIWSLGHKPFEESDGKEYLTKITTGYRLPPPPGCPKSIYKLMIECWNPIANKRIIPSELSRTLQKSDRTLLPSSITLKNSEELSTTLGASLDTSSHIFTDLQNTYLPK